MMYLKQVRFPDLDAEGGFLMGVKGIHDSLYPYGIFPQKELSCIDFAPVTIFCGGNGCGKTTALNVLAQLLDLKRSCLFNRSDFFESYLARCRVSMSEEWDDMGGYGEIITSDDVFDYVLKLRSVNDGVSRNHNRLTREYLETRNKAKDFRLQSLDDYEELKSINDTRRHSLSQQVRALNARRLKECSNGETAFRYFVEKFQDNGLYLLDEPENSLSPRRQVELVRLIEDSARFFNCQFVIASHSPFFLALSGAKVYDFDALPVAVKPWTEIETVRSYYDFFKSHESEF